jgi:threonine dehydrogenase-like Zn-dependent dehydrogenase
MRAAIQAGVRAIEMVEIDEPPLEDGAALVRVRASGICGSDLHPYHARSERQPLPDGHEVAGELVELPDDYRGPLRVGDLVALDTICMGVSCGDCAQCAAGRPFHCDTRRGRRLAGAFAELIRRKPCGLFKLPEGVTPEQGALVEPLAVGVHAVRWARMRPGASVVVIGAGTIGLVTLMAARALGAGAVHVLARHDHQAALAEALGAASVVRAEGEEATGQIREATRGGADMVIETVGGHADTVNQAWELARIQGTVAVLGIFPERVPVDLLRPVIRELWATFPICYGTIDGRHDFDVAVEMIASGKAPVERLVTHRLPLAEAPEGFRIAADKSTRSVKVHLQP